MIWPLRLEDWLVLGGMALVGLLMLWPALRGRR